MSVMIGDLLNTYKFGWKTSYYQNTYDYKQDPSEIEEEEKQVELAPGEIDEGEECEACAI
jgi:ribonucleoside-diphosphate reductase alpha chain